MKNVIYSLLFILNVLNACSPLRIKDDLEILEQIKVSEVKKIKKNTTSTLKGKIINQLESEYFNIRITLIQNEKVLTAIPNKYGKFIFNEIPYGKYQLQVKSDNFKPIQTFLKLKQGQTVFLDIKMKELEIHTDS